MKTCDLLAPSVLSATLLCLGLTSCGESTAVRSAALSIEKDSSPQQAPMQLVWSDEFDGPTIDRSRWNYEVNGSGGGNNELQYYTDLPGNSYLENGALVIQANKEPYLGRQYTSARMTTARKFDFTYGRVEIRARLPYGKGIWPALWMMPTDGVYGGWPLSGEIDIMEMVGHEPNRSYGTLHYGDPWPNNKHTGRGYVLPQGDYRDDFHTFAIDWQPNQIRWYVDDNHFSTLTPADLQVCANGQTCPWRFDQNFFLIMNLAVGGNWPGYPDAATSFPQKLVVDYVRVYQAVTTAN